MSVCKYGRIIRNRKKEDKPRLFSTNRAAVTREEKEEMEKAFHLLDLLLFPLTLLHTLLASSASLFSFSYLT